MTPFSDMVQNHALAEVATAGGQALSVLDIESPYSVLG